MKPSLLILFLSSLTGSVAAQNTGINTTAPVTSLHVKSTGENVLTIENATSLGAGTRSAILFANGIEGANNVKYTGAIKTIGTSTAEARMGLFTQAGGIPEILIERLTIADNGNVGIGYTNPSYRLSVNGSIYAHTFVGIQTPPNPSYSLSVLGSSRFYNDLRVDGILNPNNALNIGNNASVEGSLTVENGKGIVRSTSSTQMKMKRSTVSFGASNLGAGATLTSGYLNFGEDFSSLTVTVGQCVSGTGDWAKVFIVPFNVDVTNNNCQFAITNVSSNAITFNGSWQVVLVGY